MSTQNKSINSILYLDSQLEFAKIFSRLLEGSGYSVMHYSNLGHLSENQTDFNLIMCEYKLFRQRSFLQLYQKTHSKKVPLLIFSSHFSRQDKAKLIHQGIYLHFTRTEALKSILDKISLALQQ